MMSGWIIMISSVIVIAIGGIIFGLSLKRPEK